MNHGKLEQVGAPEELYERPQTRFVASFLGTSNLLRATTIEGGSVRLPGGTVIAVPGAGAASDAAVDVGIRPEKLRIVRDGDAGDGSENRVAGTLVDVEYLGVSTLFIVSLPAGGTVTVFEQNRGAHGSGLPSPGDPVTIAWLPEHAFVLPVTGSATADDDPLAEG
jgi:spermidine/putrescine transport system ATP-binding protein